MLYSKNLPVWERWLRVALGIALIGYGVLGAGSLLLTTVAVSSAVVVIVTGFIGFCPACALVGRRRINQEAAKR